MITEEQIIKILKDKLAYEGERSGDTFRFGIIGLKESAKEIMKLSDDWPKKGDTYYFPDITEDPGFDSYIWSGNVTEQRMKNNGLVCRTKEEALEKRAKMLEAIK